MTTAFLLKLLVLVSASAFTCTTAANLNSADTKESDVATTLPQFCDNLQYPTGDVRNCPNFNPRNNETLALNRMTVLPGTGFDNLRSIDMGQVFYYNYSRCAVSNDGKYLLPDSVFLLPVLQSKVEVYAEFFEHWDSYTTTTSSSMSIDAGFFSVVDAKFSTEYESVKSHQVNDKSQTTRVQMRHKLYAVKLQPDSQLHPTFKARLFDIAANLQNNNTHYAEFLSELLVRDYGTHYITSIEAGAVLSQVDHVLSAYAQSFSSSKTSITASASANFFGKVSFGTTFSHGSSETDESGFVQNRTYSQVFTFGGPPFRPNFTISDWEDGVPDALVAIDRSGDPLHFAITPVTLPELPPVVVQEVYKLVFKSINRYYKINTRHGCTNLISPNFDFQANLDDGSCHAVATNFTFGGIYQTCQVDPAHDTEDLCGATAQENPLTGDYSCPEGYTSVHLHDGTVSHVSYRMVCDNVCHGCGLFGWSRCCEQQCARKQFLSVAYYQAYWCAALGPVPQHTGYLFGGLYTSTSVNPVTRSMTCPSFYTALHFGEDITTCVSSDYELGYEFSVPFAGFHSCSVGNPLAASSKSNSSQWPYHCPRGYSQHLAAVDEGCEIDFCVKSGVWSQKVLKPVILPPFRKHPRFKQNVTDTLVVFGLYGHLWVKDEAGEWVLKEANGFSSDGYQLLDKLQYEETQSKGLSAGGVSAISIVTTLVLCTLLLVVTVFAGYKCRRKRKRSTYAEIVEEQKPNTDA